ncbi:MAG: hypothetical protein HY831_03245 [Candidatus Aenigmarchaeota archaeon]|nr:hypothetical protein [Candidatus Aenigmarchaeota archaeon]
MNNETNSPDRNHSYDKDSGLVEPSPIYSSGVSSKGERANRLNEMDSTATQAFLEARRTRDCRYI